MNSIVTGKEMKKIDKYTIENIKVPGIVLMERAALSVASLIMEKEGTNQSVQIVAGEGNNGADGLAVARMLYLNGYDVVVYIAGDESKATDDFKTQLQIIRNLGVKEVVEIQDRDITVDAIFGVGLSRNVEGKYKEVIEKINKLRTVIYAVDIPSGVDADTGKVLGVAVNAAFTVTFGCYKIGTVLYPGAEHCGEVIVSDIGFPQKAVDAVEGAIKCATISDLDLIPKRMNYSNKGTYGKILVVAGSKDISGAAIMTALAAFKTGAGMVRIFTHSANRNIIGKVIPEAMINTYELDKFDEKAFEACLKWCSVVAIGPGIGTGTIQSMMVEKVLESDLPAVIDADAINTIANNEIIKKKLRRNVVITPHLGEMSRLLSVPIEEITKDLVKYAEKINYVYGANVVLKDARTIIATEGQTYINISGNNGMATAGSGDVLTGIIAGLIGINAGIDVASFMGTYIHGLAGDYAITETTKAGLMATDIIKAIPEVMER